MKKRRIISTPPDSRIMVVDPWRPQQQQQQQKSTSSSFQQEEQQERQRKRRNQRFSPLSKYGRIESPHLFELFHPSNNSNNNTIQLLRSKELGTIRNEKILCSIMNSWAKNAQSNHVGDVCWEVIQHLEQYYYKKNHLYSNIYLYNVVLSAYAHQQQPQKAQYILQQMIDNMLMMMNHEKNNNNNNNNTPIPFVKPDVKSFSTVMNAWSKYTVRMDDGPEQCEKLLKQMIDLAKQTISPELLPDTITYNIVLGSYTKQHRAKEAEGLLRLMLKNMMEQEEKEEAERKRTGSSRRRRLKPEEIVASFQTAKPDAVSFHMVFNAWANYNERSDSDPQEGPNHCLRLLNEMRRVAKPTKLGYQRKEFIPTTITYNTVLSAFANVGNGRNAEFLLRKMIRNPTYHAIPNVQSFNLVFKAYASKHNKSTIGPYRCKQLLEDMKEITTPSDLWNYDPNKNRYRKDEDVVDPETILIHSNIYPDTISYNTVLDAYARWGRAREANIILQEWMKGSSIDFDFDFDWDNSNNDEQQQQQQQQGSNNRQPNVISFNTVMKAWVKAIEYNRKYAIMEAPDQCEKLFQQMMELSKTHNNEYDNYDSNNNYKNKHVAPNIITYNTLMSAYTNCGRTKEAYEIFKEMMKDPRVVPNERSFLSIMDALSKSDVVNAPEQCELLLAEMIDLASSNIKYQHIYPGTIMYTYLMDAYTNQGRIREAERVLKKLFNGTTTNTQKGRHKGPEPDIIMVNKVMNAWSKSKIRDAPEQCERLLKELTELATVHKKKKKRRRSVVTADTVTYNIILDAYANQGRAQEADNVLRKMLTKSFSSSSEGRKIKPSVVSFNIVMNAWCNSNSKDAPERCEQLLTDMALLTSPPPTITATTTGNDADNNNNNNRIVLIPDLVSYTTVMKAYAMQGRAQEAERVLKSMLVSSSSTISKVLPDAIAFKVVMNAWLNNSDSQDAPEQCERLLKEMLVLSKRYKNHFKLLNKPEIIEEMKEMIKDAYATRLEEEGEATTTIEEDSFQIDEDSP